MAGAYTGTVTFRVVESFFDRDKVKAKIDHATRRQLMHAGGRTRVTARNSIKRAGKRRIARKTTRKYRRGQRDPTVSRPGKPPRQHVGGKQNLKLILYAYDRTSNSVVVGPVQFRNAAGVRDLPGVLEHGGRSKVRVRTRSGARKTRPTTVKARPFMGPALEKTAPDFPDLFKNSVR